MAYQRGTTLIEMLTAVMLIALLATFGLPAMQKGQANMRLNRQSQALIGLIQQGRGRALESGQRLTLCGSHDGLACGDAWHHALLLDASDRILQRIDIDDRIAVDWRGVGNRLAFTPQLVNAILNGSFYICPGTLPTDRAAHIVINRLGRLRRETVSAAEVC